LPQTFAQAVRSFRKRKGISGTELAAKLGVWQTAISRWETGKSMPDDGVLLRLLALAEGEAEAEVFLAAAGERMGFGPSSAPVESLRDLDQFKRAAEERGIPIDITEQNAAKVIQSELAIILSREALLSPLFAALVRYWRLMGEDPRAQQVFSDLVRYLDVNFVALRARPASEVIAELEGRGADPKRDPDR
jgi:transcriptional regulator with XRE-family HTH domain